jgi:hypothetical protein
VTSESKKQAGISLIVLAVIVSFAAFSGCTSSPSNESVNQSREAYLQAYIAGMEQHAAGQDFFNNGTRAWDGSDFRAAIADYANASLDYSEAAKYYDTMARHARGTQEKEFTGSLSGCTLNLSMASDNFVNAAIALGQNDSDTAYDWFCQGQSRVDASEALLNKSIESTPEWLIQLASG